MTHTERTVLCYLRTHRRIWGLTQRELASLMGFQSPAHLSRIENGKRAPTVESALACQVLFGIPPAAMFPHAYDKVEERVIRDIYELHLALSDTTTPSKLRKRELFSLALDRAISSPDNLQGHDS
jgi:transcriptional regulator with XRE-family HTH domain